MSALVTNKPIRGKLLVEKKEILFDEYPFTEKEDEHIISATKYIQRRVGETTVKSCLYNYGDGKSVLSSIVNRFGEEYYKVIVYSDEKQKAWNLIEISVGLDVVIRRLEEHVFLVFGDNSRKLKKNLDGQFTFCRLKPSTNVEEFTVNISQLRNVKFANDQIVIDFNEDLDGRVRNTVATYSVEGNKLREKVKYL